jgi:hypothetical protein
MKELIFCLLVVLSTLGCISENPQSSGETQIKPECLSYCNSSCSTLPPCSMYEAKQICVENQTTYHFNVLLGLPISEVENIRNNSYKFYDYILGRYPDTLRYEGRLFYGKLLHSSGFDYFEKSFDFEIATLHTEYIYWNETYTANLSIVYFTEKEPRVLAITNYSSTDCFNEETRYFCAD